MNDNPFMTPIFWLLKWCILISLVVVAIGMIPMMILAQFGGAGLGVFAAFIVGALVLYIRRRIPQRKREF